MRKRQTYMTKWRITAWRDGAVYRTELVETDWFDLSVVDENKPSETQIIYSPAVSSDGTCFRTIRI